MSSSGPGQCLLLTWTGANTSLLSGLIIQIFFFTLSNLYSFIWWWWNFPKRMELDCLFVVKPGLLLKIILNNLKIFPQLFFLTFFILEFLGRKKEIYMSFKSVDSRYACVPCTFHANRHLALPWLSSFLADILAKFFLPKGKTLPYQSSSKVI